MIADPKFTFKGSATNVVISAVSDFLAVIKRLVDNASASAQPVSKNMEGAMRLIGTVLVLSCTLAACAIPGSMLKGNIISESGDLLDFEIEVASRSGAVKAHNPKTKENFSGTYVGVIEEVSGISFSSARSGRFSASGVGVSSASSNMANASAYLQGDKGSMLSCTMQIEASVSSPHGIGNCTDQKGGFYRLQF